MFGTWHCNVRQSKVPIHIEGRGIPARCPGTDGVTDNEALPTAGQEGDHDLIDSMVSHYSCIDVGLHATLTRMTHVLRYLWNDYGSKR